MLIKKIKTANGHYIYDTWTNEILAVDAAIHALLPGTPTEEVPTDAKSRQ